MTQPGAPERMVFLRRRIAALEAGEPSLRRSSRPRPSAAPPPMSTRAFFEALPDALPPGGLNEIVPARPRDAAAAAGFAAALALRAAAKAGGVVWIAEDMAAREIGLPYAKGLEALGLDPARLVVVRTREPRETLWTMEEALKSRAAAVVAESWLSMAAYELSVSRRLALAARRGGALGLLLLLRAHGQGVRLASAAQLRFEVAAPAPPRGPPEGGAPLPGPLGWRLRLVKARLGAGSSALDAPDWREIFFDSDEGAFRHAFPERLPAEPPDRPDLAPARALGA